MSEREAVLIGSATTVAKWLLLSALFLIAIKPAAASEIYRSGCDAGGPAFGVLWTARGAISVAQELSGLIRITARDQATASAGVRFPVVVESAIWRISMRLRHELSQGSAIAALQCFDRDNRQTAFIKLAAVPQGAELSPISRLLRIPDESTRADLIVMTQNAAGSLWIADVLVEQVEIKLRAPEEPTAWGATGYFNARGDLARDTFLKLLVAAGVSNARGKVDWRTSEPQPGRYDFSDLEEQLRIAREYGFRLPVVLINGTPEWASGKSGARDMLPERQAQGERFVERAYWPPRDWKDWARFLNALFTHFKGRVAAWEILNEPDLWSEGYNGTYDEYLSYLRIAFLTARRADPACKVFCGAVLSRDWYLRMLDDGMARYFDGVCIHPYGASPGDCIAGAAEARLYLLARGFDKPVWVTEIGFQSGAWRGGPGFVDNEETKAQYGRRTLEGLARDCQVILWYRAADKAGMFGLLQDDGDRFSPLPIYYEYGDLTGRLPKSGGPIRLSARVPDEIAVGERGTVLLEATNTSSKRIVVKLWPVGFVEAICADARPRAHDWQGVLKAGQTKRIAVPIRPSQEASGEYLVGIAAIAEPANSLALVPLLVTSPPSR